MTSTTEDFYYAAPYPGQRATIALTDTLADEFEEAARDFDDAAALHAGIRRLHSFGVREVPCTILSASGVWRATFDGSPVEVQHSSHPIVHVECEALTGDVGSCMLETGDLAVEPLCTDTDDRLGEFAAKHARADGFGREVYAYHGWRLSLNAPRVGQTVALPATRELRELLKRLAASDEPRFDVWASRALERLDRLDGPHVHALVREVRRHHDSDNDPAVCWPGDLVSVTCPTLFGDPVLLTVHAADLHLAPADD